MKKYKRKERTKARCATVLVGALGPWGKGLGGHVGLKEWSVLLVF